MWDYKYLAFWDLKSVFSFNPIYELTILKPDPYQEKIDNLKITFLDKKYETITPIENTPIFVR